MGLKPKQRVEKICPLCGTHSILHLDVECYDNWKAGMLVQNAFPDMNANNREILISGICCWDENVRLPEEL